MINPITRTDYPDPDVIRVGDTFYMVSTTMYFFPGGEILRSYDLVHWEIAARIFDSIDGTDAEKLCNGQNAYGKGMWAASLRYHDGKFYVLFVSHGQENTHLYIADRVKGPWEHKRIKGYYHDASLLFDDDGRVFVTSGNMQIHLTELSSDLSGPKPGGIDQIIIKDDPEQVFLGYEGSHFYKIGGRYYITLIHWPKAVSRRTEAVFVSDRVEGPYVGRDVCSDDMGYHGQGVAQGGIVDTPDGHWYSIMFRDSGAIGRVPALTPVTFRTGCGSGAGDDLGGEFRDGFSGELRDCPGMSFRDGLSGEVRDYHGEGFRDGLSGEAVALGEEVPFPEFGENGLIPADFATPDLKPGYEYEPLFTSDDFMYSVPLTKNASEEWGKEVLNDSVSLKKPWQWNHIPDGANWRILPEGGLAITTGAVSANPTEARNTLTQRMAYPTCSGTVTVDATGLKDGDFAGLIALQGKFGMIGIAKENGSFSLVRLVREEAVKGFGIGSNDREPGVITDRIPIDGPIIRLRIDADFTDMADTAQFSYEKNGTFVKLGGPHKLAFRLDHFTGARFGLCVFATKEPGGTALFRDFRYE